MKIVSYNVNGINGRLDLLLRWLDEARPDVVCLQELKAPDDKFPRREIERAGYGAVWHGQKSWNGVAILARDQEPLMTRRGLPGDDVYAPERWRDDALFRPEVREAFAELVALGWTDAVRRLHPDDRIYTFWKYWRNAFARDAGLRIDHFLLSPSLRDRLNA